MFRNSFFHFSTSKLLSESEESLPAASAFMEVLDFLATVAFSPVFFLFTGTD